jgi:hypothetical protein
MPRPSASDFYRRTQRKSYACEDGMLQHINSTQFMNIDGFAGSRSPCQLCTEAATSLSEWQAEADACGLRGNGL